MSMLLKPVIAATMALALGLSFARGQTPAKEGQRMVAAGGVITEIAYALGRADRLVGVDSTSLHPAEALKSKPNIGYVRALSAEGVLSLKPNRVIAVEGAGPPDVLRLIGEAKVPVTIIPEDPTEEGVLRRIRLVGEALEAPDAASQLVEVVRAAFTSLARDRATRLHKPRVLFVLSLQNGRAMVAGRNSSADAMIRLAGGKNAGIAVEGFKPLSDEGILAAAPDIILMMKRGDHAVPPAELFAHPAFRLVPAARKEALIAMDGLYLLGFGPRTPEAARELMREMDRFATRAERRAGVLAPASP
jgi:iron complex transport system substrate-binding protein